LRIQEHDMCGEGERFSTTYVKLQHPNLSYFSDNAVDMRCIYCDDGETRVIDTRDSSKNIRRRRECKACGRRFTTYETAEKLEITVIKREGESEQFSEEKIREGVEKAAKKTSIDEGQIEEVVEAVKDEFRGKKEIKASKIGEIVKKELKKRDKVAYIRFASVYDSFEDVESFEEEVKELQRNDN